MGENIVDKVKDGLDVAEAKDTIAWPDVVSAGHDAAKKMFGGKYDKTKANGVVNGMIKRMKDGDTKVTCTGDACKVVANAFHKR